MARPFLLIDGYNLMHAAGMARLHYGPGGLERCRNQFLNYLLRHLTPDEAQRGTVVFDAGDAPTDVPRRQMAGELQVLFARPGSDADSLIEQLIREHSAPRQIRLVSSDHRLQKAARRRRAKFVDSEDFFAELEVRGPASQDRSRANSPDDPRHRGLLTDEETDEWLKVFGEVPGADEIDAELGDWQKRVDELNDEDL